MKTRVLSKKRGSYIFKWANGTRYLWTLSVCAHCSMSTLFGSKSTELQLFRVVFKEQRHLPLTAIPKALQNRLEIPNHNFFWTGSYSCCGVIVCKVREVKAKIQVFPDCFAFSQLLMVTGISALPSLKTLLFGLSFFWSSLFEANLVRSKSGIDDLEPGFGWRVTHTC